MIFFNGRCSSEFGLYVERYPARPAAARKVERVSVPGRSGDILFPQEAWDNVTQSYDVYLSAEEISLPIAANAVIAWLNAPGYCRLEDSYDPEVYRLAEFTGPLSLANTLNMFGRATISFNCTPQRYLKRGEYPIKIVGAATLYNPTGFVALPLITLHGKGSGTLTIGNHSLTVADCNETVVDCGTEDVYRGSINLNNKATGDFPRLEAGQSIVTLSGGIQSADIKPRWWSL